MSWHGVICPTEIKVMRRCFLALIIMVFCLSSCVFLPLSSEHSSLALVGQQLESEELNFISIGSTTRDELIARLGKPPVELVGLKILAYPWIEIERNWVVGSVTLAGAAFVSVPQTSNRSLFIAIDDHDHVLKWSIDQQHSSDKFSIVLQARRWAESNGLPVPPKGDGFSTPELPLGQAVIVLYRVKPAISMIGYLSRAPFTEPLSVAIDDHYCAELLVDEYVVITTPPGSYRILVDPAAPYRFWPGHPGWSNFSGIHASKITLDASANKIYFLETQATLEIGLEIVTSLTARQESEAKPALAKGTSIW